MCENNSIFNPIPNYHKDTSDSGLGLNGLRRKGSCQWNVHD